MSTIKIRMYVPRETALRVGATRYGDFVLEPTPAQLEALSTEDRADLVALESIDFGTHSFLGHPANEVIDLYRVKVPSEYGVGTTTVSVEAAHLGFSEVPRLLQARREIIATKLALVAENATKAREKVEEDLRKEAAVARRAVDRVLTDPMAAAVDRDVVSFFSYASSDATFEDVVARVRTRADERWIFGDVRLSAFLAAPQGEAAFSALVAARAEVVRLDLEADRARERDAALKAKSDAAELIAFVLRNGDRSQQERYAEGLLPEDELLALARKILFSGLDDLPRYARLAATDVEHHEDCDDPRPDYDVDEADALDSQEWEAFKVVRSRAPAGAKVKARLHSAYCRNSCCDAVTHRSSAMVEVEWFGRMISREFGLGGAR